jgi:hypothetical protein
VFYCLPISSLPYYEYGYEYGDVVAEPDRVVWKGGELVVERGEELLEPIQQLLEDLHSRLSI